MKVTLTGWKAVAAIAAVLALVGFRYVTARHSLDTQGQDTLREWIALELQRPLLADESLPLDERAEALLGAADVQILAMSARGTLDRTVVRVELTPSPDYPPGTELVRYYRMTYSRIEGWRHRGSSSPLMYHLALF